MPQTFQPPANLKDFAASTDSQGLYDRWHQTMTELVNSDISSWPAFYSPLSPPSDDIPKGAAPQWTGLPRTIKRLIPGSIAEAAQMVENAIPMGNPDPLEGPNFTPPMYDNKGNVFPGPAYRPQDEYLEWLTRRDTDGTISEIIFTCEGPEYWDNIASDEKLLLEMYQQLSGNDKIRIADLMFPRKVTWENPNNGSQVFESKTYNPYNKYNIDFAVHLTHPANTLGAEVTLAKQATGLYGNPLPVASDPDLICCAAYGGINRMSDPTIGSGVNTQVQVGNRVTLRNPIGLYISKIKSDAFALPDDTPFQQVEQSFEPLRPAPTEITDMIVRARFRIPKGITFNGVQLRVGDLKVNGEKIVTGGQVADVITMTLFGEAIAGAPPQKRRKCQYAPCPSKDHPEIIRPIPFGHPLPRRWDLISQPQPSSC